MTAVGRYGGRAVRALLPRFGVTAMVLALLTALPPYRLTAQTDSTRELIDRVVAVVGSQVILLSDVNERLQQARAAGMQIPEDSAALLLVQRQVLDGLIDDEVLYQEARRDTSITVSDVEVQSAVDQQYRQVRGQFRTDPEFIAALQGAGWGTVEEYRRFLTEQSRRENYKDRYLARQRNDGKLRAGTISEDEMREFFAQAQRSGQLDSLPPTITFRRIVISPRPSDSSRAVAFRLADSLRVAIEAGGDFAALARQFSDDIGSRENGGDLGFFRRGTMVRQFEEIAFVLRPGSVSPVVRTEYGYHLILVDRIQAGEVKARHILIIPKVTAVEQAAARRLADSLAPLIRNGASLDSLIRLHGDSAETPSVGPTNRDSLPQGYAAALSNVTAGQIVGPAPLPSDPPERTKWVIARVTDVQPRRLPTLDDVRAQVRARLIDQKGMANLIALLKSQTFVDVRL